MYLRELPARPSIEQYRKQARELLNAAKAGDPDAIGRVCRSPRLARGAPASDEPAAGVAPMLADAQYVIAREHGFESWPRFLDHLRGLVRGPISRFESAADAIADGDLERLRSLLAEDPTLVQARSTRSHGATLLHYVAANGVEDFRQRTPANAVEICRLLLELGADADARMADQGGTPLGLVATSVHPARAGVQVDLIDALLEAGAAIDGEPGGWNPLVAALHNGRPQAALQLAARGAALDLEGAAGVGRVEDVEAILERRRDRQHGTAPEVETALAMAAAHGHVEVVRFLLARGATGEPDAARQATPLHLAAYGGHGGVVNVLVDHGVPVAVTESHFGGTPLSWGLYGRVHPPERSGDAYHEIVRRLVDAGATVDTAWLHAPERREVGERVAADPRMQEALGRGKH